MRTVVSAIIILVAAFFGFFMGSGMNEPLTGSIIFTIIAGFICTIAALESQK